MKLKMLLAVNNVRDGKAYGLRHSLVNSAGFYKVNLKGVLRDDDYFEAVLAPAGTGKTMVLRFEAYAKNGKTIAEALANVPDVDVALLVECRGRGALYTEKKYFTLTAEEMRSLI